VVTAEGAASGTGERERECREKKNGLQLMSLTKSREGCPTRINALGKKG